MLAQICHVLFAALPRKVPTFAPIRKRKNTHQTYFSEKVHDTRQSLVSRDLQSLLVMVLRIDTG